MDPVLWSKVCVFVLVGRGFAGEDESVAGGEAHSLPVLRHSVRGLCAGPEGSVRAETGTGEGRAEACQGCQWGGVDGREAQAGPSCPASAGKIQCKNGKSSHRFHGIFNPPPLQRYYLVILKIHAGIVRCSRSIDRLIDLTFCYFTICQSIDWLDGLSLLHLSLGWLSKRFVTSSFIAWLIAWVTDLVLRAAFIIRLIDWLILSLRHWLIGCLVDCLVDWLIDWLNNAFIVPVLYQGQMVGHSFFSDQIITLKIIHQIHRSRKPLAWQGLRSDLPKFNGPARTASVSPSTVNQECFFYQKNFLVFLLNFCHLYPV